MNAQRRRLINEISSKLSGIKSDIEDLQSEEQEYYDNMPESLQSGEKGQAAESAADSLSTAASDLDSIISYLDEASGQ